MPPALFCVSNGTCRVELTRRAKELLMLSRQSRNAEKIFAANLAASAQPKSDSRFSRGFAAKFSDLRLSAKSAAKSLPGKKLLYPLPIFLHDHLRAQVSSTRKRIKFHSGPVSELLD